jgi:hypothetical protein
MRQPLTVRLDPDVVMAAKAKASRSNRTLTNYIETLMKRDLSLSGTAFIDVAAPSDIREYEAVPLPGETGEERARRDALFHAILDDTGY